MVTWIDGSLVNGIESEVVDGFSISWSVEGVWSVEDDWIVLESNEDGGCLHIGRRSRNIERSRIRNHIEFSIQYNWVNVEWLRS